MKTLLCICCLVICTGASFAAAMSLTDFYIPRLLLFSSLPISMQQQPGQPSTKTEPDLGEGQELPLLPKPLTELQVETNEGADSEKPVNPGERPPEAHPFPEWVEYQQNQAAQGGGGGMAGGGTSGGGGGGGTGGGGGEIGLIGLIGAAAAAIGLALDDDDGNPQLSSPFFP
jgi:uncharacterized membrane protein YgcG